MRGIGLTQVTLVAALTSALGPRGGSPVAVSAAGRSRSALWFTAALALASACSGPAGQHNPTTPSAIVAASAAAVGGEVTKSTVGEVPPIQYPQSEQSGPNAISFPPRSEPLLFRTALEAKYRDGLRRPGSATFVDQEGTVVWTQEYMRYRVNLCSHADAVLRVLRQIDGLGVSSTCGNASTATFPPRNEPFDFMVQLEAKYRDGLRRPVGSSFVDVEGNIVWTQEYLRYRVSTCSHFDSQQKVFDQIDGRGVAADCTPPPPPPPPPTPSTPPSNSPTPSPTPTFGSGSFIQFTTNSTTCRCWIGTIALSINNSTVGGMGCSGSQTFPVSPGSYTARGCDREGCASQTGSVSAGNTLILTLYCGSASSTKLVHPFEQQR